MDRAVILYNSKTGTTKNYAEQIGDYIAGQCFDVQVTSIEDCTPQTVKGAEYILLGCWTKGLMVILQGPDAAWKEFVQGLPPLPYPKLALFATYKICSGSMFRNMERQLQEGWTHPALELKSRDGQLSRSDKEALDNFLAEN